jgi:hypothetical protein
MSPRSTGATCSPRRRRFALLNHNRSIALYRDPDMIALSLGKVVERFARVDRQTMSRVPMDADAVETAKDATALFQTADELYMQRGYAVTPRGEAVQLARGDRKPR